MPEKVQRLYWDANVFIKLVSNLQTQEAKEHRTTCQRIFDDAIAGRVQLYTSTATVVEVRRREEDRDTPAPVPQDVRDKLIKLFQEPYITLVFVDGARAEEARELCWQYPWLKTVDAIQVASAVFAKVDVMQTYDGLTKPNGILKLNKLVGSPPLVCRRSAPRYFWTRLEGR